jgi:cysteine desulfurase
LVSSIYFDYNAGAPLRLAVQETLTKFASNAELNPSSIHREGQRARLALERAREQVAALIGAQPNQVVFTSGGTESNNLAIFGAVRATGSRRRIVSSTIEHSSIIASLVELERAGCEIVRVAPDSDGLIDPEAIVAATERPALISIGLANSEIGTVQRLEPIAQRIRAAGAIFHVDAAQAAARIVVNVETIGCDLMTLSAHKLGAPAGVGALYVRDYAVIAAQMLGGPQERGLRAGTPNLVGAICFGAAAEAALANVESEDARLRALITRLYDGLKATIPGLQRNGSAVSSIPNTLNLTFPDTLGETMLIALDLEGVRVSMGSACAAGAVEPSHVLLAIGLTEAQARSSIRISVGWATSQEEIDRAIDIIPRVWRRVAQLPPWRTNRGWLGTSAGAAR